jgi:hypothetical protein
LIDLLRTEESDQPPRHQPNGCSASHGNEDGLQEGQLPYTGSYFVDYHRCYQDENDDPRFGKAGFSPSFSPSLVCALDVVEQVGSSYVTLTSVYVPYTSRSAAQISPTVAYARTASMMYGIVFASEIPPFARNVGSCAAAFFSA